MCVWIFFQNWQQCLTSVVDLHVKNVFFFFGVGSMLPLVLLNPTFLLEGA